MRDLLRRSDVEAVLAAYKQELAQQFKLFPKDLALHHRISAVQAIESRLRLLSHNGLTVIQGGKK